MANILQNRRQVLKRAGVLGALGTLATLFIPAQALAKSNTTTANTTTPSTTTAGLGGSWNVKINPQGSGSPAPFQALHTFSGDGTIITAEQRDMVPPTFMSSGHGSWVQLSSNDGPDDFAYDYQKLVVDTKGNLLGTVHVHAKIELCKNRQSYSGKGTYVFQPVAQPPAPDYIFILNANRIA